MLTTTAHGMDAISGRAMPTLATTMHEMEVWLVVWATMAEATITSAHAIVGVADTAMEMTADHMNTAHAIARTSARLLT